MGAEPVASQGWGTATVVSAPGCNTTCSVGQASSSSPIQGLITSRHRILNSWGGSLFLTGWGSQEVGRADWLLAQRKGTVCRSGGCRKESPAAGRPGEPSQGRGSLCLLRSALPASIPSLRERALNIRNTTTGLE